MNAFPVLMLDIMLFVTQLRVAIYSKTWIDQVAAGVWAVASIGWIFTMVTHGR